MFIINDLIQQYKLKFTKQEVHHKTERAEIMSKIIDRLESDRKTGGFKPLGAKFYAIKMANAGVKSVQDLYWFYGYLNDSKNFSSTFWWSLDARNSKK